jgi:putative membrane protein
MRHRQYAFSLAAVALLLAGCASKQGTKTSSQTPGERFMIQAAQANLAEIEAGHLATERAQSPDVRQFGSRMVRDHTQANEQLLRLAEERNVSLPQQPDESHQKLTQELSNLQGADFDRAYMRAMVEDHQHDVSEFEQQAESLEDPELRAWAAQTVPTLRDHVRIARMIQRSLESSASVSEVYQGSEGGSCDCGEPCDCSEPCGCGEGHEDYE